MLGASGWHHSCGSGAPTVHIGIKVDGIKMRHLLGKAPSFASREQAVINCHFHKININ